MTNRMTIREYRASQKKKPKYHNQKTVVDGIEFDSKKEAAKYKKLKLMVKAREIRELQLQPEFPIRVEGVIVCTYRGDFSYIDNKENRLILEDVKGIKTQVYRLKKKLLKAIYNIDILET